MKKKPIFILIAITMATSFALVFSHSLTLPEPLIADHEPRPPLPAARNIRLALLLDTSNSMDGLIDQAKSQLWNIVYEMTEAKHSGVPAELHLALYEYGNDNLSITSGYVRQVSNFTQDLDEVSRQLFALTTHGGSEYCGTVITKSLENMDWGDDPDDLKFIFIAGNEEFSQGLVPFEKACALAMSSDVVVNTIYCGDYRRGIHELWKKGAEIGGGSYMNIDMDKATVYIPSPYDDKIDSLNDVLNKTYIGYGQHGQANKSRQLREDANASQLSKENKVKRAITKSKSHAYKNEDWDLVDAIDKNKVELKTLSDQELPEEMRNLSLVEKEKYLFAQKEKRKAVQSEIQNLAKLRKNYVQAQDTATSNGLESAILKSVKSKAKEKSFEFEN